MLKFAKTTRENFDALEGRYETGKVYFISDEGSMFLDGKLYLGADSSAMASVPEKNCHREDRKSIHHRLQRTEQFKCLTLLQSP